MIDIIIILLLVGIVAAILRYLYKAKKQGRGCVGCPHAGSCSAKKAADSGSAQNHGASCNSNCSSCSSHPRNFGVKEGRDS